MTNIEIVKQLIDVCSASLETDKLSEPTKCECGRVISDNRVDLWRPIGRSDTYMIRNTLRSMIEAGMIKEE